MPRYSQRTGLLQEYQTGPFDSPHMMVQWGGKLPGNEQWSCSFRMHNEAGQVDDDIPGPQVLLAGVSNAIAAFHGRQETFISDRAKLSFVKVNAVKTDGTYVLESTSEIQHPDQAGGRQTTTNTPPNQVALAISLTTGFSRGPAHRGRFFLPMPLIAVDASGGINPASAAEIRDSAELLRTQVNAVQPGFRMVVMSRKAGAPAHRTVTGMEVGVILDTQRRRRRSLNENWQ